MLYPVQRLLAWPDEVICVTHQETVRDALTKMVANDFSQLPVIDARGHLTGIISEQSITRTYYHISEQVFLFNLTVDNCQSKAVTLSSEADIFEALDRLQKVSAVVIVNEKKPVGILTYFDATHFLRERTEALILVEDIETTLRKYIESVCDTDDKMKTALIIAFNIDKRDSSSPRRQYEEMSFGEHVQFITAEKNWPKFEAYFQPKKLFQSMMDTVREIRNQLMHFRDEVSSIQYDALQHSREWLVSRPKIETSQTVSVLDPVEPQIETVEVDDTTSQVVSGKYRPLFVWLQKQGEVNRNIQLTFEQVEKILGDQLPPTARTHQSWWANDSVGHRHSHAWLRAGWRVSEYDLVEETVTFQKTVTVMYPFFFADALAMLKKRRPGITQASKTWVKSSWNFGAGREGFTFGWSFDQEGRLRTDLYFDTGDAKKNKRIFDWFYHQREDIEHNLKFPLTWERLDKHRSCRVFTDRSGTITDSSEKLDELKVWAVDTMIAMVDTFRPLILEIPVD